MGIISELSQTTKLTDVLHNDVRAFFENYNLSKIADHTERVAANAAALAQRFGIPSALPVRAAYLHDLGYAVPLSLAVDAAIDYGIDVLDEERTAPGLLHQKLSKAIAEEAFGIRESVVLDAVECHTTLKAGASDVDLILFIADKLTWDTPDSASVVDGIQKGLETSLAHAAFFYINDSMENKDKLMVLHPWMLRAYEELKQKCL